MATKTQLYPINSAQINQALPVYADNPTITAGLKALQAALTNTTTNPCKCNYCGGSGLDAAATFKNAQTGATVQIICPACGGNGRLQQPVKLKITKKIVG